MSGTKKTKFDNIVDAMQVLAARCGFKHVSQERWELDTWSPEWMKFPCCHVTVSELIPAGREMNNIANMQCLLKFTYWVESREPEKLGRSMFAVLDNAIQSDLTLGGYTNHIGLPKYIEQVILEERGEFEVSYAAKFNYTMGAM